MPPIPFRYALGVAVFAMSAASPSFAQVIDVPAFLAGAPTFAQMLQEIDVAPRADGGFIVVWGEFNATLGIGNRIVTHAFTRQGTELAPPVRIDVSGYGLNPSIVADTSGGFVAGWMYSQDGSPRALYTRRLDPLGRGLGGEARVDLVNYGPMIAHAIAYTTTGPVYVWKQNGLWFRPYDAFGAPLSGATSLASNTPGFEIDTAQLPDGGFVTAYTNSWLPDMSWGRIFGPDRVPIGPAFVVDTTGLVQRVATSPAGEIAFVGEGASGTSEVWLRRFSTSGAPLGPRKIVQTLPSGFYTNADATYDGHGNVFVAWAAYDPIAGLYSPPRARVYDGNEAPVAAAIDLSQGGINEPGVEIRTTTLNDDCFASAWFSASRAYANVTCLCGTGLSVCGDGTVDARCETCDDGNAVNGDGCDSNCRPSECGNGMVANSELCDDGNRTDGDGCDRNCTPTGCGNGIVTTGEQCDDSNLIDGDGCDSNCKPTGCGNGIKGAKEECDDGNAVSGDGCDVNCTISRCGNAIIGGKETCDDGNAVDGDGCDSNCSKSGCGNSIRAGAEECDDGNSKDGDGCDRHCLAETCGDARIEGTEQCDDGNSVSGDGCNADCTLPSVHDTVVFAVNPVEVRIPAGTESATYNVIVQVQNADVRPTRESPGHTIRLTATDGDCPTGTVTTQPDFDRGTEGVQDTSVLAGGVPGAAIAQVTVSRAGFTPFDHRIPQRCTLWFNAETVDAESVDPTPDNNWVAAELDVLDTLDPVHVDEDEFFIASMDPLTIKIPKGAGLVTKQLKPTVRRASELPRDAPDLAVTITASDGDCPAGTVGLVDFDRRTAGAQARLLLRRGRRAKGSLGLIVNSDAFASPSDEAPRRCTVLLTAVSDRDTDASNNSTRLVLDVVDFNDY